MSESISVVADPTGTVTPAVEWALAQGEVALQVSASIDATTVIDVAGGLADRGAARPVTNDSLFPVFSVTKGIVAAAALRCVADGLFSLETPLANLWPSFAAHGKDTITVRQVLTHAAGLPLMPEGCSIAQMCDWGFMTSALASAVGLWEPDTASGYHAYTYGWLIGEPIRRAMLATGVDEDPGVTVRRLVALEAGCDEFWIGLPEEQHARVVTLYGNALGPGSAIRDRALPPELAPGQAVFGRADVRAAALLGAGAMTNARTLARLYDHLTSLAKIGSPWGALLQDATQIHRHEIDRVLQVDVSRGLGYRVGDPANASQKFPFDAGSSTFGHPGAGGSVAWGDRSLNAGLAVARSRLTPAGYGDPVIERLARCLTDAVRTMTGR